MSTEIKGVPFSPYYAACAMGAVGHRSSINWSYATFETKAKCEEFAKACNDNGYRTRSMYSSHNKSWVPNADLNVPEKWNVQYHHYID